MVRTGSCRRTGRPAGRENDVFMILVMASRLRTWSRAAVARRARSFAQPSETSCILNNRGAASVHVARDFVGYGRNVPKVKWPDNARLALSFAVNYEEGAERSVEDGDSLEPRRLLRQLSLWCQWYHCRMRPAALLSRLAANISQSPKRPTPQELGGIVRSFSSWPELVVLSVEEYAADRPYISFAYMLIKLLSEIFKSRLLQSRTSTAF